MSGYTPGPWAANLDSDHGDYVIWGPGPHEFIANIGTEGTIAFDVAEANARLIAAAPDLLEALCGLGFLSGPESRWCFDRCFDAGLHAHSPACDAARAAIAKAEGRQ